MTVIVTCSFDIALLYTEWRECLSLLHNKYITTNNDGILHNSLQNYKYIENLPSEKIDF